MARQKSAFQVFALECKKYTAGIPKLMARAALAGINDNFKRGAAENQAGGLIPWAPRKAKQHGRTRKDGHRDRRYKVPKGRAILVQTGRLRRSIRMVSSTATTATVGTDVPYAQPLQEGSPRGLPARPFIVASKSMSTKIRTQVEKDIKKLLAKR